MARKRDVPRLRRVRLIAACGGCGLFLGLCGAIPAAAGALHHEAGSLLGLMLSGICVVVGVGALHWDGRVEPEVRAAELDELRRTGRDDGLPFGVYREGSEVDLEAADFLLAGSACSAVIGALIGVAALTDGQTDWRWALAALATFGLLPALALLRLGTGTRLWLTEQGVERRRWPARSIAWCDVERVVPTQTGTAEFVELRRRSAPQDRRRLLSSGVFRIRCLPLEVGRGELLALLEERVPPSSHAAR